MGEIWAIVLAGGESRRMGTPKMLLPFRGSTMLGRVIDNVTASRIDHTLVVLGVEKDRIGELLNKRPVRVCYNANYIEGMLSSVKCGIKHLPENCRAFLVFQGDQPLILPSTTDKLIDAYLESGKGIMMPVYNNRKGHPLLIDSRFIANVEQLDNNHGLRALAEKMPGEVSAIDVDDPGILRDFDTPEDYNKEINQIL
jgi:molybdenum cofactor cytidylyltransferase